MRILLALSLVTTVAAAQRLPRQPVGSVNKDTIHLAPFSQDVGRRLELAGLAGNANESETIERTWNDFVRRSLIGEHASKLGIVITASDVDNMLLSDPPSFVRQGFADEKGRFLPDVLRAVLQRPDSLLKARYPKATTAELREHAAELRSTVSELREQVKHLMLERAVRERVLATLPIDTSAARRTYAELSSSCTADVVYLPCATSTTEPTDDALRAHYQRQLERYTAKRPMRRLALIAFSLKPTAADSAEFELISQRMNEAWKRADRRRRQAMADGFSKQPGVMTVSIDPTNVSLRPVYDVAKTHAEGDMLGPVIVRDTSYYMLLERLPSKSDPTIGGRLMRMALEVAPSRKDSILRQLDEAIAMYEGGAELGDVAAHVGRPITVTRWVSIDDSVAGSYKLVDMAFTQQLGTALDPVVTSQRMAVMAVVADSLPPGPMPFDKVRDQVREDLMREQACTDRTKMARSMRALCTRLDDGTLVVADQMPGMTVDRGVTIDLAGTIGMSASDVRMTEAVYAAGAPGLVGPILGERGWYVVNVLALTTADPSGFRAWTSTETGRDMIEIHREKAWQEFLYELRTKATISDERWKYFNY